MNEIQIVDAVAAEVVRRLEQAGMTFPATEPEYISLAEVARRTSFSYDFVYDSVRSGELPAAKKGKDYRVRLADMRSWMDKDRPKAAARSRSEMKAKVNKYLPGLPA